MTNLELEKTANEVRKSIVTAVHSAKAGHPGGSLSAADIFTSLDDFIPFNEWFIFPYGSWFFLLAGVTALLWWFDTASYDKLCLMMFSGMTFCLILYMVLPNGLDIRPTVEEVGRSNIAKTLMQLI